MAKSSGFSAGQKALQAMGVATAPSSPITQQKSNTSGQTPGQNALKAAGISGYQQPSTPQTGYGSSPTSREDEIYKALTAGMQQNQGASTEPSFVDWAGRQDLVNKYNQLQESTGFVTTVEQSDELEAQMKAIREQIDAGDIKFGNGLQSFGAADRAKNVFEGATNQYLAGLVNNAAMLVQHQGDTVDYAMRNGEFADWLNENGYELSENSLQGGETIRQAARDYLEPAADYLADTGAQNIEAAKGGLGTFGQGAVDLATNAIQMGYDVGLGALLLGTGTGASKEAIKAATPAARKAAMFIRTLGSAGQEARRDENSNATNNQQLAYGITKGGIEVATEMMFDGLAGIMGKGSADVVVEKVVSKLAKSNVGRTVLRSLIETDGEGFEEVVSDVLDPYAKMIYNGKGLKETFKEGYDVSELIYSFIIGAAMGGLGQVGSIATGQHAAKNLALEVQDARAAAFNQRYGIDEAMDALMGTSRNGQSGFNGRWGLQNNTQAAAQQNPAASSVTGLIKNAPDPNNNSQKYVATQLEALDEAAAKNIASDNRYVSAFEDLTDLPLSGTPERIAQQILGYAQKATGAQEAVGDESVPPAPQTASTEPPAALNSNQSEIAPQEAAEQATNPATEALLNPVVPEQAPAQAGPTAEEMAAQRRQVEADMDAVTELMSSGKFPDARRILDTPRFRQVYEALTGEKLPANRKKASEQIVRRAKSEDPLPNLGKVDVVDLLLGGDGRIEPTQPVEQETVAPEVQAEPEPAPESEQQAAEEQPESKPEPKPEPTPEQIPYEEGQPLKGSDIQRGTRVVNKSGTNGTILATTTRKVYVKFDNDNSGYARVYTMENFSKHFRLAERVAVESEEDGSIGEVPIDDIIEEFRTKPEEIEGSDSLRGVASEYTDVPQSREPSMPKVRSAKDLASVAEGLDRQKALDILEDAGVNVSAADYDEMAEDIQEILDEYGVKDAEPGELSAEALAEIRQRVTRLINEAERDAAAERADRLIQETKSESADQEESQTASETDEAFKDAVEHFRAVFDDQPVERSKFINGQNTYGEYSAQERADILNAIDGTDSYYVRDGEVVKERTYDTTRAERENDRSTNLPSNFRKPGKAKTEKLSAGPAMFNQAAELDKADIKSGTEVLHKSGKVGKIVEVTGSSVFVDFGSGIAEPYGRRGFTKFFRSTKLAENGTISQKTQGGQQDAISKGRDARVRGTDTGGYPEVQGEVEGQDDGGANGRSAPGLAQQGVQGNNRSLRENAGSKRLSFEERKSSANSIKGRVLRRKTTKILDDLGKGKITADEATKLFRDQWEYARTDSDKLNLIKAAGGSVVEVDDALSYIRDAVKNAQKSNPNTAVYIVNSEICKAAFCTEKGTVYINQASASALMVEYNATMQQIVDHEYRHADFKRLGLNGDMAKDWLFNKFGSDAAVKAALQDAYDYHRDVAHAGEPDVTLWEEVACDFLSNNDRVCSDPKMFKAIEASLKQFMKPYELSASLANWTKPSTKGGRTSTYGDNADMDAEIDQMLSGLDEEAYEMEQREKRREEDEFQEKRWGDKHTMENAKGWAAQERANAKAESEANPFPKHDVARQFGEENRRDIQRTVRNLAKNTSKPIDGDEAKREFDSATYGKAQKLIEAVSEFANGNMSLRELADVYSAMKGKGETSDNAFYEKSIDDTLRDLADALDEEEKRWQHWSEDGRFVDNTGKNQGEYKAETAKAVAEAIKDLNYRLQYIGRTGVTPRADLTNEVTSNKGKQKTGTAKTVADISKKFTGMQLRPDTMFKLWGGFKKGSKLYQFAEKHYKAIRDKQNAHRAAVEYFITATQMKGYKDFASGKTTIDNPIPGHSDSKLSLNTALGLLKTLETNGAIEHIIKNGTQFAISESEYYKGQNNNGFGDTPEYGQTLSLLSDETLGRLEKAKEGKDINHAEASAYLELEALRDTLKAEVMKNEVAKALYEATSKCMSYLGRNINSASRIMYGVDFATEGKNYYPLEIAGEGSKNELLNDPRSGLKDWSRIKERTGNSGALRIRAFTDVMSGYIDQATDWAAFSVLSDELELLSRNNGKQSGLKAVVGSNFGRYYSDWLENYVADLNGTRKKEGLQFTGLRSNLASAALTLNAGVAMKQSPSYWDAAGVIDMKYLVKHSPGLLKTAKSFENNPLIQEVEMRTGMLGERKLGLGVVEVGEATENARSLSNKVNGLLPNWMTNWISKTDVRTTSNLMLACADQVLADDPNLKAGTENYYKAVADKFEEVILKTQPVYTKQARADYMRVQNDVIRTLAMFRTQQTQNFNQLVTAVGEYRNAYGKDKAAAAKQLRQVATGQVVGSAMFAILSAVAKAGLHKWDDFEDEEGNFDAGKTAKRVGLNFLGSVAATVWFGDKTSAAVIDALTRGKTSEFSGLEDNVLSMVSDAVTSGISFAKNRDLKSASSLVFNLSQALGIPTRNAYNLFNSAAMFGLDGDRALTGGSVMNDGKTNDLIRMISNYNKQTDKQRARATFDAAMRASAKGNNEKAETLMATLDYNNEDVVGAIKAAAKERFALGEIDMATYQKILTKWGQMSASDAKAYAEGQEEKRELAELMENDAVAQLDQQISDAKDRADEYDSSRDYAAMDLIIGALLDDADTDKLVRAKTSKGFRTSYEAMRQAGMTPKEVSTTYKAMDGDNNGSLKQDELVEYYLANPGMEYIIKQIWITKGWKTSWETKRDKAK